jgi:hypothetical protein
MLTSMESYARAGMTELSIAASSTNRQYGFARRFAMKRVLKQAVRAPIIIEDPGQLQAFAASRAFASNRPLILTIPGLPSADALSIGERLNKDRAACGCSTGAWAMAVAFAVVLAMIVLSHGLFTVETLIRLPIAAATAIVFAGLGKAIGMAVARQRARREVSRAIGMFAAKQ